MKGAISLTERPGNTSANNMAPVEIVLHTRFVVSSGSVVDDSYVNKIYLYEYNVKNLD